MTNDYEKAVNVLMKDVKDLRSDMKDVISALQGKAAAYVDSAKESLHESATQRLDQVRDAGEAVGRSLQHGFKDCTTKMKEHPLATLLAVLGVGVVVGGLLQRRRQ